MNRLKELPERDRPYEKAKERGVEALTDTELLAVLLRSGTRKKDILTLAESLLSLGGKDEGLLGLTRLSYEELLLLEGIGEVRAVQIMSAAELARRIWRAESPSVKKQSFLQPEDLAHYYMQEMRLLLKEQVRAVFLDGKMRIISDRIMTVGIEDASIVSIRELMIEALRQRAVSVILLHNHPDGDPSPSDEDKTITEAAAAAGELVGIRLSDHIIIGGSSYYSFKECGEL